jgi:hypothetical protein
MSPTCEIFSTAVADPTRQMTITGGLLSGRNGDGDSPMVERRRQRSGGGDGSSAQDSYHTTYIADGMQTKTFGLSIDSRFQYSDMFAAVRQESMSAFHARCLNKSRSAN